MANTDLRVQRTKKILKDTFNEMIVTTDFEKITIKDLCDKAMINRRTFYLHYSSIEDILEDFISDYTHEYYDLIKDFDTIEEVDELVRMYFTYSEEKGMMFERINTSPNFEYIRLRMIQKVEDYAANDNNFHMLKKFDKVSQNLIHSFINWACVGLYREWVKNGRRLPMDKAIKLSANLIKNGLKATVKENRK